MAQVACFCGCLYSFDGDGGACPKCGEYASLTAGPPFNGAGLYPGLLELPDSQAEELVAGVLQDGMTTRPSAAAARAWRCLLGAQARHEKLELPGWRLS
jgi:hypothetical protein